ncbi:hypothetical protein SAMD00079811_82700 (plasmid) [Scytonema sp. HK-05]|uniref:hypothetical protein n=1 Tax=Scytonema sp. HK-05 TaxID=1137095 RepID=UPI000937C0D5|nr:hypothetical protein [Scytonema sp. HK-05]OKH43997.1 hypothetical protein NIES2130_38310 [Scytonema sp. HK-05]BAY50641.1 hypothetical protein SAMD00079811_82700 [Scytonema sp. HK-05]
MKEWQEINKKPSILDILKNPDYYGFSSEKMGEMLVENGWTEPSEIYSASMLGAVKAALNNDRNACEYCVIRALGFNGASSGEQKRSILTRWCDKLPEKPQQILKSVIEKIIEIP